MINLLSLEVLSCLEETELDLPGGVVQEQEEARVEVVEVLAEWGAIGLEPGQAASASAPAAEQGSLTK